jgi:hypothetical protein
MADAHIYAMTDTWNDSATSWVGDSMDIALTGAAADSIVIERKINGSMIWGLNHLGHMAVGAGATLNQTDPFGNNGPTILNVRDTLTDTGADIDWFGVLGWRTVNLSAPAAGGGDVWGFYGYADSAVGSAALTDMGLFGGRVEVRHRATSGAVSKTIGLGTKVQADAGAAVSDSFGARTIILDTEGGNGTIPLVFVDSANLWFGDNTTAITDLFGYQLNNINYGAVIDNARMFYSADLTGLATNGHYSWFDAPGVLESNAAGEMRYHNPGVTKYVPGAADSESIVWKWDTNVGEIGTEKTGGGTLRNLRLLAAAVEIGNAVMVKWGTTSSFPALKRSSTVLQGRLGDDSAFAPLQGKLTTDTAATTGLGAGVLAALTNASITLYDSTGQAYRVPCII